MTQVPDVIHIKVEEGGRRGSEGCPLLALGWRKLAMNRERRGPLGAERGKEKMHS